MNKTKLFMARLDTQTHERLQELAKVKKISMASVLRVLVDVAYTEIEASIDIDYSIENARKGQVRRRIATKKEMVKK